MDKSVNNPPTIRSIIENDKHEALDDFEIKQNFKSPIFEIKFWRSTRAHLEKFGLSDFQPLI